MAHLAPTVILLAFAAVAPAQRQFAEMTQSYLPAQRDPGYAIAAADVDGDGHTDLFVGNNSVAWGWQDRLYLGDGTGSFVDATASHLPAGTYRTGGLAFGDVDGDGDLDLVAGCIYQNRIYINDGSGRFADETTLRLPADIEDTRAVVLRDFDGDQDLDLAFACYRQDQLYLNDGNGFFTDVTATHMAPNSTSTWDLAAADVDADGDVDLMLAEQNGHALLLNDGSARFTNVTAVQMPAAAAQCYAVAFADVDADGDVDLASSYRSKAPTLYRNDGSGTFVDVPVAGLTTTAQAIEEITFGDIDGDGDADLIAAGWFDRWTPGRQLFVNDGSGTFTDVTAQLGVQATTLANEILLVDVDADGDLDLASADYRAADRLAFNDGSGHFVDATPSRLSAAMEVPGETVLVDVDGDGDRDLLFANGFLEWQNWPNRLHLNDG